jgi:hypothetical protein
MLDASRRRIAEELPDDAVVLDVGGWAKPLTRADWVLDLLPYETRGLYGYDVEASRGRERFSPERWVQRDMCDHEPWPFADGQFDFAVCSHTLEDIRDPVWVCRELQRVARAGYIEVPDRREEQCYGIHGAWAGWSHHRWLVDVRGDAVDFVGKPGLLSGRPEVQMPRAQWEALTAAERVQQLWWKGSFAVRERVFVTGEELDAYLAEVVPPGGATAEAGTRGAPARRRLGRMRATLGQLRR